MGESIITRRAGAGGGETTITFDNYAGFKRKTPTALSEARDALAGAAVGSYALFAGGENSTSKSSTVDAYSSTLIRTTPPALYEARHFLAGATAGGIYAIFAGGMATGAYTDMVEAYASSLTSPTPTTLSEKRYALAGASIGDYALFAGGL